MCDDTTRLPGVLPLRYHCDKSLRYFSKASPGQRFRQRHRIQIIKAAYASCVDDDMSITSAIYEPRIALIRQPAFGFDDKACLEKRMLDAIKLRELLVRPSACTRSLPHQREDRTTHVKLTLPAYKAFRAQTLRLQPKAWDRRN